MIQVFCCLVGPTKLNVANHILTMSLYKLVLLATFLLELVTRGGFDNKGDVLPVLSKIGEGRI